MTDREAKEWKKEGGGTERVRRKRVRERETASETDTMSERDNECKEDTTTLW